MATTPRQGLKVHEGEVLPEWIDINDHMNVAYYLLAFDHGVDRLWERFGLDADYIRSQNNSTFAVECHVTYQRELKRDERFEITSQVLAFDAKRIHHFMRMYHARDGHLVATAEWMNLHVDMDTRRVSPWPDAIIDGMRRFVDGQNGLAMPEEAGRRMRVAAPAWNAGDYD